jgi:multimeric flavodoxin WrbA
MKILAINSSHQGEKGFTKSLINKIFEGAKENGAVCENINLINLKINPCAGCNTCQKKNHLLKCIYEEKDDVRFVFNKMKQSDIIIFATPIYLFNMSGIMKLFLDRINSLGISDEVKVTKSGLFFHAVDDLCLKPYVLLTTCGNVEQETPKNVISYFKTYAKFMDAKMVGNLVGKASKMLLQNDNLNYPKTSQIIDSYYQAGKELALNGKINKSTEKKANQNIFGIPFFDILIKIRFIKNNQLKKQQDKFK